MDHLISPDVAGTMRVIHSFILALFSGPDQTMQQFMWQADIAGVVHFVRDSMLVLLSELGDEGRGGTNDGPSNQP